MKEIWNSLPEYILLIISKYLSIESTINLFTCNKTWNQLETFNDVLFSIHGNEITNRILLSLDNILTPKRIPYDIIESSSSSLTDVRPLSFDTDSQINQFYSSFLAHIHPSHENSLKYLSYQLESNYILSSITIRLSEFNDLNDIYYLIECKYDDEILESYSSGWIHLSYQHTIHKFQKPILSDKVVIYLKTNQYNNSFISFESVTFLGIHISQLDTFSKHKWIHLLQNQFLYCDDSDLMKRNSQHTISELQIEKMFKTEAFLKIILILNKGVSYIRQNELKWKRLWKRPKIKDWKLILAIFTELYKRLVAGNEEYREIALCLLNITSYFIYPNMSILNPNENETYMKNRESLLKNGGLNIIFDILSCLKEEDYGYFISFFVNEKDFDIISFESYEVFSLMSNSKNIETLTTYKTIRNSMKRLRYASNLKTFQSYDDFKSKLIKSKSKKELLNVLYSFEKQEDISCILYDIIDIQCFVTDQVYIKSRLKKLEDFGIGGGTDEKKNVLDILFNLFGFPDQQISKHAYNCFIKIWNESGQKEKQFIVAKLISIPYLLPWKRALQLLWNCYESRQYALQVIFTLLMCTNLDSIKKNDAAKSFVYLSKCMNIDVVAKFISMCLIPNKKESNNESVIVVNEDIDIEKTKIYINYNNKDEIYSTMTGVLLLMKHYCKIEPILRKIEELRIINTLIKVCIEAMSWGVHELRLISEKIFHTLELSGIKVNYHTQFYSIIGMKAARQSIQINEHEDRITKLENIIESLTNEITQLKKQALKKKKKEEEGYNGILSSEKIYKHKSSKSDGSGSPKVNRKTISIKYHSDSSISNEILNGNSDNTDKKSNETSQQKNIQTNNNEKKPQKKSRGSFLKAIGRKLKGSLSDDSIKTSNT